MGLKDYAFTFNPNKKGLRKILGDLETEVMEIVWASGEITVRGVYDRLKVGRDIAYTTVMTVMSRLADKGVLAKRKEGNAFVYRATASREEFTQSTVQQVINGLLTDFATPAMSQFVDALDSAQLERIEELAKLIEAKRKGKDV